MLLPAGMAVALLWFQWRKWRLRSWVETTGLIDSSRVSAREVRSKRFRTTGSRVNTDFITDESIRTGNFAAVTYSFTAGSTTYHGNRICLMGEPDGTIPEILKRYPRGKAVIVYYNPKDPNECILEKDAPGKIREVWLGTIVLAALILGVFFVLTEGADWLPTIMAKPSRAPAVMLLIVVSLLLLMFSRVFTKQASAMKKWPTTAGRIIRSDVTTTQQQHRRPNRSSGDYNVTMYVPRIVYSYEVGGHAYEGDEVGWSTSSNKRSVAEKQVKRYPLQSQVQVFYNPDNPVEATLSTSIGVLPVILWGLAGVAAVAAVAVGWLVP
jgi:hypothetical protein